MPSVTKRGIYLYPYAPISLHLLMEIGAGKVVKGPKGYVAAHH